MKIYYFVAYYAPERAYSYSAAKDEFLPYSPIYRRRFFDQEQAEAAARHARHKHPSKRKYIFVDSATIANA